jgi:hypothetical protein
VGQHRLEPEVCLIDGGLSGGGRNAEGLVDQIQLRALLVLDSGSRECPVDDAGVGGADDGASVLGGSVLGTPWADHRSATIAVETMQERRSWALACGLNRANVGARSRNCSTAELSSASPDALVLTADELILNCAIVDLISLPDVVPVTSVDENSTVWRSYGFLHHRQLG